MKDFPVSIQLFLYDRFTSFFPIDFHDKLTKIKPIFFLVKGLTVLNQICVLRSVVSQLQAFRDQDRLVE